MVDPDLARCLAEDEGYPFIASDILRGSPEAECHGRPRHRSGKGSGAPMGEILYIFYGAPVIQAQIESAGLRFVGLDVFHLREEGELVFRIRFEAREDQKRGPPVVFGFSASRSAEHRPVSRNSLLTGKSPLPRHHQVARRFGFRGCCSCSKSPS